MFGYAAKKMLESVVRLAGLVILLCLLIQLALAGAHGRGAPGNDSLVGVIDGLVDREAPAEFVRSGEIPVWLPLIVGRAMESGRVLAMAVVMALSFGFTFGFLAGRLRAFAAARAVVLPFSLAVWAPPVWLVCLCGWWLVERRGQPLMVEAFPAIDGLNGIEDWWRALFPAAVLGLSVIGTQIRTIAGAITEAARPFHVRAAMAQGQSGGKVFYNSIVRNALTPVVESFGAIFPMMLGLQIFVEWAFRYPGLGRLMVDGARIGSFEPLLVGGLIMAVLAVALRWLEDLAAGFGDRRRRLPGTERRVEIG